MEYAIQVQPAASKRARKILMQRSIPPEKLEEFVQDVVYQLNGRSEFAKSVTAAGVLRDNGKRNEKEFSYRRADMTQKLWFQFEVVNVMPHLTELSLLEFDFLPASPFSKI